MMFVQRIFTPDRAALGLLFALWLLFFWRLFTPVQTDQASLTNGDFSGQFVAFGAYQYARFAEGEVPLWNPYNNGGLPFIADTQAAVFYPPRLLTILLSKAAGGWSYHALELEMTVHVLAYSWMMYALVRRMTLRCPGSVYGAFVAALVAAYGGFLTGYPPLQLALLEASIWLPLAALGVLEATQRRIIRWRWLALTGFGLGLSWMAGHPQTSWFLTYLLVAYFGYRVFQQKYHWRAFVVGALFFGMIAFGLAAVQLLPGVEYLPRTARTDLGFDAKGSGFLFQDLTQFVFPGILGPWWPLYVGITGLTLAVIALLRRARESFFWGAAAITALLMSFGENSALFHVLYNALPGLRYFRGQERAVYLVANSLAILAGLGMVCLVSWNKTQYPRMTRRLQGALALLTGFLLISSTGVLFTRLGTAEAYSVSVSGMFFSALIAFLTLLILRAILNQPSRLLTWLLVGLLAFDLFTVNMDNSSYDPIPPSEQLAMTPPPLVNHALQDVAGPFRVDGFRGVGDNYASLYKVMDIRGISPLFINSLYTLIEPERINPVAWELLAVRYVFTDWNELPVPSEIVAQGEDRYGPVNLHRLRDPRPFALLLTKVTVVDSDAFARALLGDPNFNPRDTVILNQHSALQTDPAVEQAGSAEVRTFSPEYIEIEVNASVDAILSIAQPDYPGWHAAIDGQPTEILRAYGGLSAVTVPEGRHVIRLIYDPLSYRAGAILSLFTWGLLSILGGITLVIRIRSRP